MSAYSGTNQIYGQTKLACEDLVTAHGGTSLRLGLVHGGANGGMIGALRKLVGASARAGAASRLVPIHRARRRHGAMCGCGRRSSPRHIGSSGWPAHGECHSVKSSPLCARPSPPNRFARRRCRPRFSTGHCTPPRLLGFAPGFAPTRCSDSCTPPLMSPTSSIGPRWTFRYETSRRSHPDERHPPIPAPGRYGFPARLATPRWRGSPRPRGFSATGGDGRDCDAADDQLLW